MKIPLVVMKLKPQQTDRTNGGNKWWNMKTKRETKRSEWTLNLFIQQLDGGALADRGNQASRNQIQPLSNHTSTWAAAAIASASSASSSELEMWSHCDDDGFYIRYLTNRSCWCPCWSTVISGTTGNSVRIISVTLWRAELSSQKWQKHTAETQ